MTNKTVMSIYGLIIVAAIIGIGVWLFVSSRTPAVDDSVFRNSFNQGCVTDGGGTFTMCDCMFTEIKAKMGLDGVLAMSATYDQTGVIPPEVYGYVAKCLTK